MLPDPDPLPPAEETIIALSQAGWEIGSDVTEGGEGLAHRVWATKPGRRVQVEGATEAEAWWRAVTQAWWLEVMDLPMLGRG